MKPMTATDDGIDRGVATLALLYLVFVVYGSLVPFAFADRPLHEAINAFLPPRWIPLAATDRADWIANAVLYFPLAWLGLETSYAQGRANPRAMGVAAMVGSLLLLAVAVEFVQAYFAPRTVSLNDLVAEALGILAGAALWLVAGGKVRTAVAAAVDDPARGARVLAFAVAGGYVLLALFPFDFVTTRAELDARLHGPMTGVWIAQAACTSAGRCAAHAVVEAIGGLVLGIALAWMRDRRPSTIMIVVTAAAWSMGLELAQLGLVSGISQGLSAAARAAGMAAGFGVAGAMPVLVARVRERRGARTIAFAGWTLYVVALVIANGLYRMHDIAVANIARGWPELHWLPFYYHYFVSEQRALVSACVQAAMYAPVGVLLAHRGLPGRRPALVAALAAAFVCAIVEVAKLASGRRADPTDILIAAVAGWGAFVVTAWILRDDDARMPRREAAPPTLAFSSATVAATALLLVVVLALLRYPLPSAWLALALLAYGCAVVRWPHAWLVVLPALIPVLDLAPWTGWLFIDEIDLVAMVTLCALSLRAPRAGAGWPRPLVALLVVIAACAAGALVRGTLPIDAFARDMFWSLHYPTNAWRAGKAILLALLLIASVRRWSESAARDGLPLAKGMTLGLAGAGVVVMLERAVMAGFLDFGAQYRAVGAFSAASTAGAQLESYVCAAVPFALLLALRRGMVAWRLAGVAALLLGAYAVAATVSRTALAGAAAASMVFALARYLGRSRRRDAIAASRLAPWLVVALCAAIPLSMVVAGRMAAVPEDLQARLRHWSTAMSIAGATTAGTLFGAGLGAYPSRYLWEGPPERRPALYSFRTERGQSYVHVAPGTATFLDQAVPAERAVYELRARLRADAPGAQVTLSVCEKWILYSAQCRHATLTVQTPGQWQGVQASIPWPGAHGRAPFAAPVRLSINGGSVTTPIDVTDLSLTGPDERNLVANGSFAAAGTRWFVSADDHWAWNVFDLFVEVLFEQGWIGLLAFAALLGYATHVLLRRALRNDAFAAAALAALAGFLVPALFDSVIDDPRMRLLLLVLLVVPLLRDERVRQAGDTFAASNRAPAAIIAS